MLSLSFSPDGRRLLQVRATHRRRSSMIKSLSITAVTHTLSSPDDRRLLHVRQAGRACLLIGRSGGTLNGLSSPPRLRRASTLTLAPPTLLPTGWREALQALADQGAEPDRQTRPLRSVGRTAQGRALRRVVPERGPARRRQRLAVPARGQEGGSVSIGDVAVSPCGGACSPTARCTGSRAGRFRTPSAVVGRYIVAGKVT